MGCFVLRLLGGLYYLCMCGLLGGVCNLFVVLLRFDFGSACCASGEGFWLCRVGLIILYIFWGFLVGVDGWVDHWVSLCSVFCQFVCA